MAYGLKYELFFSDIEKKPFKIEIYQKDFVIDPFGLGTQPTQIIGTDQPCLIQWDAEDNIYSPIIGSRCTLNFFVTDTTIYDDFYKADEREYKVKILEYTSFGKDYDDEDLPWNLIDQNWDGKVGSAVFYNPIWEGFIVVDRYQEAVLTKPYPITLEAIDGLGTLDSFDVPYPTTNSSNTENLFFYLKEILKLTGHEFDIYVANDIRIENGSANDTIFHDIEVDKYIFSNENLTLKNAKKSLEQILKITNSRIFQSFAKWYIISNSSLIDNRIVQGTVASVGDDIVNEPAEQVPAPVYGSPDITIQGISPMYDDGTSYSLIVQNSGTDIQTLVWTLPNSNTVTQNKGDILFGVLFLGSVSTSQNGTTYSVTATDANAQTDTATFTLNVQTQTVTPTQGQTGEVPPDAPEVNEPATVTEVYYKVELTALNNVANAYISPVTGTYNYSASEAGNSFTMTFNVVSTAGEFTSASQITSIGVSGGFNISKQLLGDFIRLTVTGTLPVGGHIGNISAKGGSTVQQFTNTFNVSDNVTNATVVESSVSATAGSGKSYSKTITVNANSGYQFNGIGNISVLASSNIGQSISVSKTSDTQLIITVSGTIGIQDQSTTLTVSGTAISANNATTISISPTGTIDISSDNGYFDLYTTANGNFYVTTARTWVRFNTTEGTASTSFIRIYFDANTGTRNRKAQVNFYEATTNNLLTSVLLNQDGIA